MDIFWGFSEVATTKKTVLVRKVTRGSPDSDDSFGDESPEGYLGGRDDQFLVSDRSENKFYGSVHGAPTGNAAPFDSMHLGIIGRKIEEYGYLCPGLFPWVNPGPATHESGKYAHVSIINIKSEIQSSIFSHFRLARYQIGWNYVRADFLSRFICCSWLFRSFFWFHLHHFDCWNHCNTSDYITTATK